MASYSIWVMEYAHVLEQATSLFVYGAHNQGYRKMPYGYVVLKGQGHAFGAAASAAPTAPAAARPRPAAVST